MKKTILVPESFKRRVAVQETKFTRITEATLKLCYAFHNRLGLSLDNVINIASYFSSSKDSMRFEDTVDIYELKIEDLLEEYDLFYAFVQYYDSGSGYKPSEHSHTQEAFFNYFYYKIKNTDQRVFLSDGGVIVLLCMHDAP